MLTVKYLAVHPLVAYYACPECLAVVEESAVFVSPDIKHDNYAVGKFTDLYVASVEDKIKIEHHVQYSDGSSNQYKSKIPFQNVSEKDNFERAYFGLRHGKSPCDALGGVTKKAARDT